MINLFIWLFYIVYVTGYKPSGSPDIGVFPFCDETISWKRKWLNLIRFTTISQGYRLTNLQSLVSKHSKIQLLCTLSLQRVLSVLQLFLYWGCFPVLLSLACSLSHVIPLLSDQPITFHIKQLSFSVLKYWQWPPLE